MDIFSLIISTEDIFSINGLTMILKITSQCDTKHIYIKLQIKTTTSVLNDFTYIIIRITVCPIKLGVMMSFSTFKIGVILYLLRNSLNIFLIIFFTKHQKLTRFLLVQKLIYLSHTTITLHKQHQQYPSLLTRQEHKIQFVSGLISRQLV